MHTFETLRETYPVFVYEDYHIDVLPDEVRLTFDFSVPGLAEFHPTTRIPTGALPIVNAPDSGKARAIVFALGLTEAVSYYKAVCSPVIEVRCGSLSDAQTRWWKKLWFHGLGEFFYRNGVRTTEDEFVTVRCTGAQTPADGAFRKTGVQLVPIGGGKDSAVTLSLLEAFRETTFGFTVNDQQARSDTLAAAGLPAERMVRTYRTIDPALLELNRQGFLNGHTPFSAIVAFLSLYCAYLLGGGDVVLSNEASANEATVPGTDVNHQYSKSFAFEQDFTDYVQRYFALPIRYFSLLRPFNEMQIACKFAHLPQYHAVFRSCNAGSKQNVWCRKCAKCLFVCVILSPFLSQSALRDVFGEDLLDKPSLLPEMRELCGLSAEKPFECIGTVDEVRAAMWRTIRRMRQNGETLPYLAQWCADNVPECTDTLPQDFNTEHHVPEKYMPCVKEMYDFVRTF